MAVTVGEALGREFNTGRGATAQRGYICHLSGEDVGSELAVVTAVETAAPASVGTLVRGKISVTESDRDDLMMATVQYVPPGRLQQQEASEPPETGESVYNFEIGLETLHITQSIETIHKIGQAGDTAPDYKGAINVTNDSVEGCDISVPIYNWSETHWIPHENVTDAYRDTLHYVTGKVNADTFRTFDPGQVMFLGVTGSRRGSADWELTYRFSLKPNQIGIQVGDLYVPNKKGWEYLWVRYREVEDTELKMMVMRPYAAYVEKVYKDANFSQLGI